VRPLRILFADDQADIRTLTAHQLKRRGHHVVPAKDGREALKKFRSASFDVILLDQEMPRLTGDQVARAIRKAEVGKKVRAFLIASTGNSAPEDVRRLKDAGFDTVLSKPFQLEDLHRLLASFPVASSAPVPSAKASAPAPVNFSEVLARIGGDKKLLQRMIRTFLRDTPKRLAAIATALRREDAEALASLAHALKGSVSIFGAEPARKLAQDLQELGRAGNLSPASDLLQSLKEEIANLLENLRGYAKQTPARPKSKSGKRPRGTRRR
jgi:two-component system sensor histidine kinase EvgS